MLTQSAPARTEQTPENGAPAQPTPRRTGFQGGDLMQPDKDRASHAYGAAERGLALGFCQLRSGVEPSLAHRLWHGRASARAPAVEKRMLIHAASSLSRAQKAFPDAEIKNGKDYSGRDSSSWPWTLGQVGEVRHHVRPPNTRLSILDRTEIITRTTIIPPTP